MQHCNQRNFACFLKSDRAEVPQIYSHSYTGIAIAGVAIYARVPVSSLG